MTTKAKIKSRQSKPSKPIELRCKRCSSWAVNLNSHGRDKTDIDLCDVCYWRKRAEEAQATNAVLKEDASIWHFLSYNMDFTDEKVRARDTHKSRTFWHNQRGELACTVPKGEDFPSFREFILSQIAAGVIP